MIFSGFIKNNNHELLLKTPNSLKSLEFDLDELGFHGDFDSKKYCLTALGGVCITLEYCVSNEKKTFKFSEEFTISEDDTKRRKLLKFLKSIYKSIAYA